MCCWPGVSGKSGRPSDIGASYQSCGAESLGSSPGCVWNRRRTLKDGLLKECLRTGSSGGVHRCTRWFRIWAHIRRTQMRTWYSVFTSTSAANSIRRSRVVAPRVFCKHAKALARSEIATYTRVLHGKVDSDACRRTCSVLLLSRCERKGYRKTPMKRSTVKDFAIDDKHEQSV